MILTRHFRFEFVNKLPHLLFTLTFAPKNTPKPGFCGPKPHFECGLSNFDSPRLIFFEVSVIWYD